MSDIPESDLSNASTIIEVDPDKRYCIEVPYALSNVAVARLKKRWQELMTGTRDVMILDSGAKIVRIPIADDPDHHPNT